MIATLALLLLCAALLSGSLVVWALALVLAVLVLALRVRRWWRRENAKLERLRYLGCDCADAERRDEFDVWRNGCRRTSDCARAGLRP